MRVAPVSVNTNKNNQHFGLLKYELDKPSKELYYQLCSERPYSSTKTIHEEIVALDKALDDFNEESEQKVQSFLNCNPATRPLVAREVWPEDKPVNISVKRVNVDDKETLIATFDGKYTRKAEELIEIEEARPLVTDFRRFLRRMVRDPQISNALIIPEVSKKPLYIETLKRQERVDSLDPEEKERELREDINEWIG